MEPARMSPEGVFSAFVRNANTAELGADEATKRCEVPEPSTDRIVLLTHRKSSVPPPPIDPDQTTKAPAMFEITNVVALPVGSEVAEPRQVAAKELDRVLGEVAKLRAEGHPAIGKLRLDQLARRYPDDLVLLRRIADHHVECDDPRAAVDALFVLAKRLFERRQVPSMRGTVEQILGLDPGNGRAMKLLGLLDERPGTHVGC